MPYINLEEVDADGAVREAAEVASDTRLSFLRKAGVAGGAITSPQLKTFLAVVTKDERAHVAFLKKALGRHAVKKPKFNFKGIPTNQAMFAATAQVLENTGVHAYLGQAGNIKTPAILGAAASIVTIEARHAGAIGLINGSGGGIAPSGAFDTPLSAAKILAAVKGTGFIVG